MEYDWACPLDISCVWRCKLWITRQTRCCLLVSCSKHFRSTNFPLFWENLNEHSVLPWLRVFILPQRRQYDGQCTLPKNSVFIPLHIGVLRTYPFSVFGKSKRLKTQGFLRNVSSVCGDDTCSSQARDWYGNEHASYSQLHCLLNWGFYACCFVLLLLWQAHSLWGQWKAKCLTTRGKRKELEKEWGTECEFRKKMHAKGDNGGQKKIPGKICRDCNKKQPAFIPQYCFKAANRIMFDWSMICHLIQDKTLFLPVWFFWEYCFCLK